MAATGIVLRNDVLQRVKDHNAAPRFRPFLPWARRKGFKAHNATVKRLFDGGAVPRKLLELVVDFQLSRVDKEPTGLLRAAGFEKVLAESGIPDFQSQPIQAVADRLVEKSKDYLGGGMDVVVAAVRRSRHPLERDAPSLSDTELREAIRWMFVGHGNRCARANQKLSTQDAITLAEESIGIKRPIYEECVFAWRAKYPWSVVPAKSNRMIVGLSIILPVSQPAYHRIRRGEQMGSDTTPDHLATPTRHLFVEAVAERTVNTGALTDNNTFDIRMAMSFQIGKLLQVAEPTARPIHFLSRGASAVMIDRLRECGYRPLGTLEAKTGLELWELVLDPARKAEDIISVGTFEQLGKLSVNHALPESSS